MFFCQQKKPDKVIGFTQSSCPAFHLLPSDEDYKTLPFVISLQRWDKGLEYASFELDFMKYPYIILSGLLALWFLMKSNLEAGRRAMHGFYIIAAVTG